MLTRSLLLFVGILLVACEDPALVITVTRDIPEIKVGLWVCHAAPNCHLCAEEQNVFEANVEQSTTTRDVAIYFSDPPSPFNIQLKVVVDPIDVAYKDRLPLDLEGLEWPVYLQLDCFKSKPPVCPDKACSPWTECPY